MLGKMKGGVFDERTVWLLKDVQISGPMASINGQLYLPAPKDIIIKNDDETQHAYAIRPMQIKVGEGSDLPEGVIPAMLPESVKEEFKPAKVPPFWSVEIMTKWLINPKGEFFDAPPHPDEIDDVSKFLNLPIKESRFHVKIDPNRGGSERRRLFETIGLDLSLNGHKNGIQFAAKIESDSEFGDLASNIDTFHSFGGERRLAYWKTKESQKGWTCPDEVVKALVGKRRIRMVLATPAIFSEGWMPGWIKGWPKDEAPDYWPKGLKVKLISACTERWKPISGWSLENGCRGSKAIKRLVPAGSVYFFEIEGDAFDAGEIAKNLWLKPMSDNEQDRLDGFGLAVWGLWDFADCDSKRRSEF